MGNDLGCLGHRHVACRAGAPSGRWCRPPDLDPPGAGLARSRSGRRRGAGSPEVGQDLGRHRLPGGRAPHRSRARSGHHGPGAPAVVGEAVARSDRGVDDLPPGPCRIVLVEHHREGARRFGELVAPAVAAGSEEGLQRGHERRRRPARRRRGRRRHRRGGRRCRRGTGRCGRGGGGGWRAGAVGRRGAGGRRRRRRGARPAGGRQRGEGHAGAGHHEGPWRCHRTRGYRSPVTGTGKGGPLQVSDVAWVA